MVLESHEASTELKPAARISRAARLALAVALIVMTAFWGLVITFSDYPPTWSRAKWLGYILVWHVPSAFVVGCLVPHRWSLALATASGAGLLLLFSLPHFLVVLGASVGLAGYFGGLIARRLSRKRADINARAA